MFNHLLERRVLFDDYRQESEDQGSYQGQISKDGTSGIGRSSDKREVKNTMYKTLEVTP